MKRMIRHFFHHHPLANPVQLFKTFSRHARERLRRVIRPASVRRAGPRPVSVYRRVYRSVGPPGDRSLLDGDDGGGDLTFGVVLCAGTASGLSFRRT